MINGIINVYKEKDFTSFDVVAKLRGILKQKKIGHTGTLDPAATGVLPVCLGNATKVCELLTDKRKEYVAECLLGVTTDTQDMTGTVLSESEVDLPESLVRSTIMSFIGPYAQVPPMYSALKVDGKRLYELARAGKEVERKARPVTIYEIEILEMELPVVKMRVLCSKGTYIRTLCHDIGEVLGCGAAMQSLVRTKVEPFTLENARKLDEIEKLVKEGREDELWIPVDSLFSQYPKMTVSDTAVKLVQNGNTLDRSMFTDVSECKGETGIRVYDASGRFYGIYAPSADGVYKPEKMFL